MIERLKQLSVQLDSAAERLESHRVWSAFVEVSASWLPYLLGMVFLADVLQRRWAAAAGIGVVSLCLCLATIELHRTRRGLLRAYEQRCEALLARIDALERQNDAFREVALSAVAVMICHEHNIPPPFENLKRNLDAVGKVVAVHIHRSGEDTQQFVN